MIAAHAGLMAADGHDVRIVAGRGGTNDAGSVVPSTSGPSWRAGSAVVVPVPLVDPIHERVVAMQVELSAGRVPDSFEALVAELRSGGGRARRGRCRHCPQRLLAEPEPRADGRAARARRRVPDSWGPAIRALASRPGCDPTRLSRRPARRPTLVAPAPSVAGRPPGRRLRATSRRAGRPDGLAAGGYLGRAERHPSREPGVWRRARTPSERVSPSGVSSSSCSCRHGSRRARTSSWRWRSWPHSGKPGCAPGSS